MSEVAVIKGKFFKDGLRINPFKKSVDGKTLSRLIFYGIVGLILVRLGFWNSPPIDTFYFAFAFGLYLDVRVELRELRMNISHSSISDGGAAVWSAIKMHADKKHKAI